MEHFYEEIPGYFSFADLYREQVQRCGPGSQFVEVGGWKGRSAAFLAVEVINSQKSIHIDVVDTWDGGSDEALRADPSIETVYDLFKSNIQPVSWLVNAIRLPSVEAAGRYVDKSIDFVFIDADRSYESVMADIAAWYPKVKVGGVLAGSDHGPYWDEAMRAVNDNFGDGRVEVLPSQHSWMVQL